MTALLAIRASVPAQPTPCGNAAVVRSLYAAFSRLAGDGDAASYVEAYFHPDCEYRSVEETAVIRGHDGLIRWVARWLEAWEHTWDQVDEVIEAGGTVVAAIRVHGRGRRSGMEISHRQFDVFELGRGRIRRIREYLDPEQALEDAGLLA
jgi:ketosteroid isomerase-like protein